MTEFAINTHRVDPYGNFVFQVQMHVRGEWRAVAGVSKVSPLKRTTELISHRSGGDPVTPHHSPAKSTYEPVTMERGITHDLGFEEWAQAVHSPRGPAGMSLAGYKRDLQLEMLNLQHLVVRRYLLSSCWVSEFTATPELDANGNGVAFESIVVQYEGWSRDVDLGETAET